jgi:hypothetical protein
MAVKMTPEDHRWADEVKARDEFTCRRCGRMYQQGDRAIQAHHLFTRTRRSTRYDLENGVTLCTGCHRWVHANPADARDWAQREVGKVLFLDVEHRSRVLSKRPPTPTGLPESKRCSRCRQVLPASRFGIVRRYARGTERLRTYCNTCYPEVQHGQRLKRVYGIDLAEYDALRDAQGGVCAICHGRPGRGRLVVDHDVLTGSVRGLLCNQCNTAIGLLRHDPMRLTAAVEYLIDAADDQAVGA